MSLSRRKFLKGAISLPAISTDGSSIFASPRIFFVELNKFKRVRPGDPLWPSPKKWEQLNKAVNGNLVKIESPLVACKSSNDKAACTELFKNLKIHILSAIILRLLNHPDCLMRGDLSQVYMLLLPGPQPMLLPLLILPGTII